MSKYAERWMAIRKKVAQRRGWWVYQTFPTNKELAAFEERFEHASKMFDQKLYKPGKRKTSKDISGGSAHPLARHNMPNFNFVSHQIFMQLGIRKKIDAHFYWRLPKTDKVINTLTDQWRVICKYLEWPCFEASMVTNAEYAEDPEVSH